METLSTQQILDAGLDDWRKLAQALHARYRVPDLAAGAAFAGDVAKAAEAAGHDPQLTLSPGAVDVMVCTVENGWWVTAQDLELARTISDIARRHGLEPRPGDVAQIEYGLDTASQERIAAFWAALLTGDSGNVVHETVLDPLRRVPNVWFQPTEPHEPPRQRWHPDLWLAPEVVAGRIQAAVAAGGEVVDDAGAPSFIVLADPDGNKVCICSCLDRD
jgi:4a-hydroxytetrahydrobiopterin dehydratase